VSDKNETTYRSIFEKHQITPGEFLMVGNSVKSDILPAVALGAHAVHVPYETTWIHEHVEDADPGAFATLAHLGLLPQWLVDQEGT